MPWTETHLRLMSAQAVLREGLEIKILICYLLHHIHRGMSFAEINEVFRSKGIANYFEYSQEISRLLHSGHIVAKKEIDGVERFYITDLGIKTSTMFEKDVPGSHPGNNPEGCTGLLSPAADRTGQ